MPTIQTTLARELNLTAAQVAAVIALVDEGNTIPFIARYRKEATGGMDDAQLRAFDERLTYLRTLEARKDEVLRAIDEQGKLTPELRAKIEDAAVMQRVEDLYKPYKKKRATRASKARDAGLEPLALLILAQGRSDKTPLDLAAGLVNAEAGFPTPEAALQGAQDIVAEAIADDAEHTEALRNFTKRTGALAVEAVDPQEKTVYEAYYDFSEPLSRIPNHRVLAVNRGEKEGKLRAKVRVDADAAIEQLERRAVRNPASPFAPVLREAAADGYKRLMAPALDREMRSLLTERAQADAMEFWLTQHDVDGFRCDMACEVPIDFWQQTLPALRKEYPGIYLLAEGEAPALHDGAFDASYAWELHHLLNDIAQGRKSAADLRAYVARDAAAMPREAFRLMFTSNHDENSWAGTEFERMGDAARVMALLTFTLPNGQPLVYTGQEMGFDHRFEFFEKDPVPAWERNGFTDFYAALIRLRHENPALAAGERGGQAAYPLGERTPDGLMLFSRTAGGNEVTVAANLSAEEVAFDLPFEGSRREFFTGKEYTGGTRTVLPAWQWLVFAQDRR